MRLVASSMPDTILRFRDRYQVDLAG